uniref:Uncharacterized protein n=1 Tax=Sciurus vulgaris TaxID=55149 RepID=A0A8D2AS20_SCIVU
LMENYCNPWSLAKGTWKYWIPKTSTLEEDKDCEPLCGEYSEDNVNDLVWEAEVDGEQQTQKPKGGKIQLRAFQPGRESKVAHC